MGKQSILWATALATLANFASADGLAIRLTSGFIQSKSLTFNLYPGEDTETIKFQIDQNACNVNEFGYTTGCTLAFYEPLQTVLELISEDGQGNSLYRLEDVENYRLVISRNPLGGSSGTLLEIDESANVLQKFPLFPSF
jgi:hypothetical protein